MNKNKVNIRLDPAAELYREKLFLRSRSEIASNVIELPSLEWQITKKQLPSFNDTEVVRNWMRYLAYICAFMAENQDLAFVTLIRVKSEQDTFSLSLKCPYPQIIEIIKGPEKHRNSLIANFEELDITHKFALPDTLCPVVIAYSNETKRVLITNENHFSNPKQFLDPDLCNFTSGMLNFIGTLTLLEAQDCDEEYFQQAESWMKSAMAKKRDEWLRWFLNLGDENVIFAPDRFLIDPDNPETFFYDYPSKPKSGA